MGELTKTPPNRGLAERDGKRATLRTIAELTGLSQSTVSLALRGGSRIKAETRDKVAETAARLGYVPDRAGVRLRTGKTNVIALVLDRADDSIDFARHLIQGVGHGIGGTRYHLNVTPEFDRAFSVESIRYILENRSADGVIITHTSPRDPRVQLLIDSNFPFVSHGRTEFYSPHAFHDYHSEEFARLAVERMAELGAKRVVLVVGRENTNNHHNIVTAYQRAGARLGVDTRVVGHKTDRAASEAMRQFGRDLAHDEFKPNGIICDSELRSICMITGLADEGVVIGRDMHFICKQTTDLLPTLYPTMDTIEEDVVAAGEELARLLLRRIAGEPPDALQTLSEPKVHWRR
jgi:LacI family transcriptional regulator